MQFVSISCKVAVLEMRAFSQIVSDTLFDCCPVILCVVAVWDIGAAVDFAADQRVT